MPDRPEAAPASEAVEGIRNRLDALTQEVAELGRQQVRLRAALIEPGGRRYGRDSLPRRRWQSVAGVLGLLILGFFAGRATAPAGTTPLAPTPLSSVTAASPGAPTASVVAATRTPVATALPSPSTARPAATATARQGLSALPAASGPPGTPTPLAAAVRPPAQVADVVGWQLTFEDEFESGGLDPLKWTNEHYWRSWLPERQLYVPDNVRLFDGMLSLESRRQQYQFKEQSFKFTSGYVHTRGKFAQLYGRFEVRARLPKGKGVWPAHWLMPKDDNWPPEIDIMEMLGSDPTTVYMSNHWGTPANRQYQTLSFKGPDFSAGFHTFAVEWEPGALRWYIDGVLRVSTTTGVPAVPMYLILNTAIGGVWPGDPDESTALPQSHDVQYVRVYRRSVGPTVLP